MRKKPTIAGLQREVASLTDRLKETERDNRRLEQQRDERELERARASHRADELAMRLQGAEQEVEFLKGKIEGMQWMLQQVPADE